MDRSSYRDAYDSSDSSQESRRPLVGARDKRTRGRPKGNPKPLNAEERRMRNAFYERGRRVEEAEILQELKEIANLDPKTAKSNVIIEITHKLRRAAESPSEDINELRRINAQLERQIADAEARLTTMDAPHEEQVPPSLDLGLDFDLEVDLDLSTTDLVDLEPVDLGYAEEVFGLSEPDERSPPRRARRRVAQKE
ncbi:unnamed protein product [Plutella xylostella]|uniref:(diamondback moth) hypothetical protein n=1 Tax=Plutella xylostella TaxID=51655 RepID=A0A8S4G0T9_PLUXY|nr:unnamed protein product [Plutella xylostella]